MLLFVDRVILPATQSTPIPRDLELMLPLDSGVLKVILVALFLVHILFVNLMAGGSILSVFFEILGLSRPRYDALAKKIAQTITVNKSLAVVMGVGPLLCINLVYTTHFYAANALTGYAWWSIIPLVTLAFLLSYLHKYTWDRWQGQAKSRHLLIGGLAAFLFMTVPFIFLANINLMLFPDKWSEVGGFFSALRIGNVFPRYFHFLTASLALTAVFLAGWFGRKGFPIETELPEMNRRGLLRLFYRIAFFATIAQFVFGPLLLFTLPFIGINLILLLVILCGILIAVGVLFLLSKEIKSPREGVGKPYLGVLVLFSLVVLAMGTGRHLYRENSLIQHKTAVADALVRFQSIELATHMRLDAGLGTGEAVGVITGEKVFANCAACHAVDRVLAAPSLREVYSIYKDNPQGIIAWAKNPGKKRLEFAPMPSMAYLGDEQLGLVAQYILDTGAPNGKNQPAARPD